MSSTTYTVFGQRYQPYDPFVLAKDVEGVGKAGFVLDDGKPKKITLGIWSSKNVADIMAENIKKNVPKRSWKIWVE